MHRRDRPPSLERNTIAARVIPCLFTNTCCVDAYQSAGSLVAEQIASMLFFIRCRGSVVSHLWVYTSSSKSVVGAATGSVRHADWTLSGQRLDRDGGQEEASFSSYEIYRVTDISWSSCCEDRFFGCRALNRYSIVP